MFESSVCDPIISVGGASARTHPEVTGSSALRIVSWVAYAASLVDGLVLIILGFSEATPPAGVITSTGLLGSLALIMMGADAMKSANQAKAVQARQSGAARVSPYVAPGWSERFGAYGTAGLRLTW